MVVLRHAVGVGRCNVPTGGAVAFPVQESPVDPLPGAIAIAAASRLA
jgi:hypothetical protein